MSRHKRIQFPGACYYVALRGNNRQDLFLSNQDRRHFLALLKTCKERYQLQVYAYCLMTHDAYFLVQTAKANLSEFMQSFSTSYTKRFNAEHNTLGHVFQGRYKALLVEEALLTEMTRYLHLEPMRAGLKEKPWRYVWSSCRAYVEAELKEPLVDSGPLLKRFGKNRLKQSVMYLHYLKERVKSASQWILPVARGLAVGSEAFAAKILALPEAPPARDPAAAAAARKILAEVAARRGMGEDRILSRSQWRDVSSARREAMHRIWKEARLGVNDIARLFERTPSAVSQALRAREEEPA